MVSQGTATNKQVVADVLSNMKKALETAQHNLTQVQERTKRQVKKVKRAKEWKQGDQVPLSTWHLHTFAMHLPMELKRC